MMNEQMILKSFILIQNEHHPLPTQEQEIIKLEAEQEAQTQLKKLNISDGNIYFVNNNGYCKGAIVSQTAHALIQHSRQQPLPKVRSL